MTTWRRRLGALLVWGALLAASCQRSPRTAAELIKAMPRSFAGKLHLQGETEPRRIRLEPKELSVRSEHVLEFNRVAYQLENAPGESAAAGEARIRGTISAPGLAIRLEAVGADVAGGEDAVRPETFTGKLSGNMNSLEAEWSTGLGQKGRLTLQAAPP